jgi:ribosomal protein L11 methylase PrmA
MIEERGSFRDPAGKIFYINEKVFRKITIDGQARIDFLSKNNLLKESIDKKFLIPTKKITDNNEYNFNRNDVIFEHERIPYISYPYEWSFSQLKSAALHHLNFHLFLLENNATLIDASAFNIQFLGTKPIFIDFLSIKEYQDGEFWNGHKQFCENFLNPLILKSKKGISFNNWFKGNLEGIHTSDLNSLLSIFDKFSYNIFVQVYLLNKLDENAKSKKDLKIKKNKKNFPKKNFIAMLSQLKKFIASLKDKKKITIWDDYSQNNTYKNDEEVKKIQCVEKFCDYNKFQKLADIGCNNGLYSQLALKNNCKYVVGFDFDINAIDQAFQKSHSNNLNFLPLFFDASNPSSNLGWSESEREGFIKRGKFDAIIALAFEHHLAIAKNIPLEEVINWLMRLAPKGLIEFVPKNDETVQKMLELKGDIFKDYNIDNFEKFIKKNGKILNKSIISASGRTIYEYQR